VSVSIDPQNHASVRIVASHRYGIRRGAVPMPVTRVRPCDNRAAMRLDDRFDELIDTLSGFHRTWLVYLGVELGLFAKLREAAQDGLSPAELAAAAGCAPEPIQAWASAADAHELAELRNCRLLLDEDTAVILLDEARPEFLGGQFVHSVIASLDWSAMLDFFRTGEPIRERPDRYRQSIERLTVQDVAVFFQEALAELPQLVDDLGRGGRVVDIHCGGGRWLIAMARRVPALVLVGIEFEADSVERARANVATAGLTDRIEIRHGDVAALETATDFALAYFQYALHQLRDPVMALRSAWGALRPGGRLLVLDWSLPSTLDDFRTRQGELIAGVQLDELYQGTALATREGVQAWFVAADLPQPVTIDLPSGASLFVVERA
jgi:SAM-dependent methyltransferase